MATQDFWRGWKTSAEQCEAIRNGDIQVRNKWYADNLDRIRKMAYNYARKYELYKGFEQDMINGVWVDCDCFKLSEQTAVCSGKTMSWFVITSFSFVKHGGYAYCYKHNRKMLSGEYKSAEVISLDAPMHGKRGKRDNDGVTLGELLPGFEAEADTPDHTEIYITEVCKLLKQYPKMLTFYELYMRGFNNAEIAEAMGISRDNVPHYLQRLGKRLFKLKGDILPMIEQYGEIDCTRFYDMERQERHTKGRKTAKTDEMTDDEYKRMYGASALWKRNNAERRKEYNREYYARRKTETHAADMGADGSSLRRRAHAVGVSVSDVVCPQFSHTLDKDDLTELREYRENRKSTRFQPLGFKLGALGGAGGIRSRLPQGDENVDR